LFKENVGEEEILAALDPVIRRFAQERQTGEHFGDFVIRAGIVKATVKGKDFHD
jgi:sulfite reductase (NADPH) hemoprotein beta-component